MSASDLKRLRDSLRSWGASYVVVTNRGSLPTEAAAVFTAAIGRPPVIEDRAWVWNLGARPLPLPYDASAAAWQLVSCAPTADSLGPVAARKPLPQAYNRCIAGGP